MIRALVEKKRIVVCVGPGGVGKTTTAAALGATAARLGRKTLVCTIDPAPRLADALGVGGLGPEPRPVPPEACRALGIPAEGAARLFAVRLDTARAFARLVDEQVADPEMRRRIFDNAIYRQVTTSLTGSQEYAATLALYELAREGAYDLIVLDTPPTANALDFLDAPKRIAAAVSSPALSWFARSPAGDDGDGGGLRRLSLRRLRAGGALMLRRLAKLVG
ncbi:MAG TPA: ArsA-related P-loop ATPase, partial [Polyangia bacterium]|nr:ArsA-related P-loop ATPase [Polyangia bacterium]